MIALGGIIGASLFVGSANVILSAGPAAILSYLGGGLIVFLAMRMLGEMAAVRPAVGSFMEYARVGLGDWAAYIVGWLYWYFWVGVIAYEAVAGGGMLNAWFPGLPAWAGSLILLAIFVTTNLISLRAFGETEFWLASIKVVAIVVFLGAGLLFAFGLWPDSTLSIANLWQHGGFMPNGFGVVVSSIALVLFAYFGAEIAVMAAAESEDPAKGTRQAANTVIWRVMLFYVGAVLVIVMVVPWNQLPSPDEIPPFAYVFSLLGIPFAEEIMTLVIFTAVISVLNSGTYSASRMFAALSEQRLAPAIMSKRSKRGVPVAAVIASTAGGLVATLVNFIAPSSGIYEFIMNSTGLVALFVFVFIAVTQWRLRAHDAGGAGAAEAQGLAVPGAQHRAHRGGHRHRRHHAPLRGRARAGAHEPHRGRRARALLADRAEEAAAGPGGRRARGCVGGGGLTGDDATAGHEPRSSPVPGRVRSRSGGRRGDRAAGSATMA
ncbi:amino acid permease [Agrococcus sediminis]|uniref:amino acid permease n=1 Tax=Agrococcus sediminis TaxID=2599924 RepID=UPI001CED1FCF|nr:amino acid permease [Agrococcus sediminis]